MEKCPGSEKMKEWKTVKAEELTGNPFVRLGRDWMLLTAGTLGNWNTMTAAWGGLGVLWNWNVVYAFVRPTRHTYKFMEENDYFTAGFFPDQYKEALNFCGTHSGKNVDKAEATGLVPEEFTAEDEEIRGSVVGFSQADTVLVCKKVYFQDLEPGNFLSKQIESHYSHDYHRMYVGKILTCKIR